MHSKHLKCRYMLNKSFSEDYESLHYVANFHDAYLIMKNVTEWLCIYNANYTHRWGP